MTGREPKLATRLAQSEDDVKAAQRLRYSVFVEELGADGDLVDHENRLERDRFDPYFDHILLIDETRDPKNADHVVGVYRVMRTDQAEQLGRFYSEDEYDLAPLKATGRKLLELGRSCLHADYRGGAGMFLLWNALASYVQKNNIEVLFGVASFHGTDPEKIAMPLSYLHHNHLAPEDIRVKARESHAVGMDQLPVDALDRKQAMHDMPSLIKAYIRLGGFVGEDAFIDHEFNTIDICLLMDTARMSKRSHNFYKKERKA